MTGAPSPRSGESRHAEAGETGREGTTMMGQTSQVRTDLLRVRHVTRYRYRKPVSFGRHRAMFRPHETQDLRLLTMNVTASPAATIHWIHDVFSNSVTVLEFADAADHLEITAEFDLIRTSFKDADFPIAEHARRYPFEYGDAQLPDLAPCREPHFDDANGAVTAFAQRFVTQSGGDTWALLTGMTAAIKRDLVYQRREEPGVQEPAFTLETGAGSCRDFAELMSEALRRLGFAVRFVTGYLYDPALDSRTAETGQVVGAGATHAWVQVFIPGAGWIEFDPTNGDVANGRLIRTGVGRMPAHVAPVAGSYMGDVEDALGLEVEVEVTTLAPPVTR